MRRCIRRTVACLLHRVWCWPHVTQVESLQSELKAARDEKALMDEETRRLAHMENREPLEYAYAEQKVAFLEKK